MKRGDYFLIVATVIWGSSFPLMKIVIQDIPPLRFLAYRFAVALIPVGIIAGKKIFEKDSFAKGSIIGFALFLGHAFQIYGLKYTSPTNSAFITALYLIFIPFLAAKILGDKVYKRNFVSLVMAVGGLYLISGGLSGINTGDVLTLLCALSFAFQIILVQKYSRENFIQLTFWEIFWVFALSSLISLFAENGGNLSITIISVIIYLGIFGSFVAFAIQMKYQPATSAFRASLIYTLEPVFGHIFSIALLSDFLKPAGYIGAALILSALWIDVWAEKR